jgi:hypothetical protein
MESEISIQAGFPQESFTVLKGDTLKFFGKAVSDPKLHDCDLVPGVCTIARLDTRGLVLSRATRS